MKLEKLKIGNTYYAPARYCPTSYTYGTLIKILDKKHVVLQRRKDTITYNINKLHTSADKAVRGRKAQERARIEMKKAEQRQKKREEMALVSEAIQKEVRKVRRSAYATIFDGKYIIKGYIPDLQFNTLDEMVTWITAEIQAKAKFNNEIIAKEYKYLRKEDDNGCPELFYKLAYDFKVRIISCRKYDGETHNIPEEEILDYKDVMDMNILVRE